MGGAGWFFVSTVQVRHRVRAEGCDYSGKARSADKGQDVSCPDLRVAGAGDLVLSC